MVVFGTLCASSQVVWLWAFTIDTWPSSRWCQERGWKFCWFFVIGVAAWTRGFVWVGWPLFLIGVFPPSWVSWIAVDCVGAVDVGVFGEEENCRLRAHEDVDRMSLDGISLAVADPVGWLHVFWLVEGSTD